MLKSGAEKLLRKETRRDFALKHTLATPFDSNALVTRTIPE